MQIHLIAGPPFGPGLYDEVIARLRQNGLDASTLDPFATSGTIKDMISCIQEKVGSGDVMVAHGSAVPLVAAATNQHCVKALYLSNGPINHLDPAMTFFSKPPKWIRKAMLQPLWLLPAFRSSAGLRRLVVNPYVMDHDTIVRVCKPLKESPAHRKNYAAYMGEIQGMLPISQPTAEKIYLIWANSDLLYPTHQASRILSEWQNAQAIEIEGAKHLHPIESPWALADIISGEMTKA